MSKTTLRPCPFCGGDDVTLDNNFVVCLPCETFGPEGKDELAVTAWNTRPAEDELVKALEGALDMLEETLPSQSMDTREWYVLIAKHKETT